MMKYNSVKFEFNDKFLSTNKGNDTDRRRSIYQFICLRIFYNHLFFYINNIGLTVIVDNNKLQILYSYYYDISSYNIILI